MIIVSGLAYGIIVDAGLVVRGDAAATAQNIMQHETLFRAGIATILFMYALVVALSWTLYLLLKPISENLALLALLFRVAEAVVGIALSLTGLIVLSLLPRGGDAPGQESDQALVAALLDANADGLALVLLLVGIGGSLFSVLFYRSRYIPRLLAGWGIATYLSMVALAFLIVLVPNRPTAIDAVLFAAGSVFELTLGLWLLIRGIALTSPSARTAKLQRK